MVGREAMELKVPLIAWNGLLAVFSLAGTLRMGEEFLWVTQIVFLARRAGNTSICEWKSFKNEGKSTEMNIHVHHVFPKKKHFSPFELLTQRSQSVQFTVQIRAAHASSDRLNRVCHRSLPTGFFLGSALHHFKSLCHPSFSHWDQEYLCSLPNWVTRHFWCSARNRSYSCTGIITQSCSLAHSTHVSSTISLPLSSLL